VKLNGENALRCCIVLVNYNGLADTLRCLRSLEAAGRPDTVVVDNASTENPSAALRREFSWCAVSRNPVNGGWAGGNNVGAWYALQRGADLVILLNNDTVVAPDFVARLTAAAAAHPSYGVLGPVIRFMDPPHEVQTDGCVFNEPARPGFFQRKPVDLVPGPVPTITEVDIVNGCCMMIRANVFRRVGFIDERFFLIHEESDFCLRARRAGFLCGVIGEALVWHKGSSSFKRTEARWQRYYDARNLYLLLSKHSTTHRRGRRPFPSLWEYFKYSYQRYAIEREAGHADSAEAVVQGVHDALARRFGPFRAGSRPAVPLLRGVFEAWRCARSVSRPHGNPIHAPAVR
jgi:GT2 family glycosyltransferase